MIYDVTALEATAEGQEAMSKWDMTHFTNIYCWFPLQVTTNHCKYCFCICCGGCCFKPIIVNLIIVFTLRISTTKSYQSCCIFRHMSIKIEFRFNNIQEEAALIRTNIRLMESRVIYRRILEIKIVLYLGVGLKMELR